MVGGGAVRIAVCGAAGRMGREVVRAILGAADLTLIAAIDRHEIGSDAGALAGLKAVGVSIEADLAEALKRTRPDVIVDFTLPATVFEDARTSLSLDTCPVIGTTGLSAGQLAELGALAEERGLGVFVAPNFAIGAVLMMEFAARAAQYLPDVEIIELHHGKKLDSPSGTALLTAQKIGQARTAAGVGPQAAPAGLVEKAPGARGACDYLTGDVPVHSVRLPGFVAHQEVIFGGIGQVLTIRHDSIDRSSFMPGVLLAARRVRELRGLVVGLEKLL